MLNSGLGTSYRIHAKLARDSETMLKSIAHIVVPLPPVLPPPPLPSLPFRTRVPPHQMRAAALQ